MKIPQSKLFRLFAGLIFLSGTVFYSCNKMPGDSAQGTLCWNFSPSMPTRSVLEIPDTDSFILKVSNSAGEVLYEGSYGNSPESMLVNPGTYTVSAVSRKFSKPEFDAPQFGDEQAVVVKAGAATRVLLQCSQLNCGLRLRPSPDFQVSYPDGSLYVSSAEGDLDYGNSLDRTGFFKPGNLTVCLKDGGSAVQLLTRNLEARDMLTLGIACPAVSDPSAGTSTEVSITVDTLRTWTEDEWEMGSSDSDAGVTMDNAYSVAQAKEHAGEKGVWVCGYIVGGDLSSNKNGIRFEPPFESRTCLAIASRSSASEKASCMSVQLTKGTFRDVLNLVDNPDLLGRKVYLRGDIEASYYGIPGLKNLSDCSVK
ncbi:MAG: DUF4493 domain-containing protein [Bacteroidales bacterium]|nr:DUF4493 domain-containing protein [Bacteroidales bacterium]